MHNYIMFNALLVALFLLLTRSVLNIVIHLGGPIQAIPARPPLRIGNCKIISLETYPTDANGGPVIPKLSLRNFHPTTRQWTSTEELEAKLHHARPGLGSVYSNCLVVMPDDCVAASTSLEGGCSERASQFGKIPVLMREGDSWRWNNPISRKLAHVLHSTL
jgi:hypothetical protein